MNFFKTPSPKEQLRKQQSELKSVQRTLSRDQQDLKRQEEQLELEIKKAAKQGNTQAAKQLAKQLIRLRQQKDKNMSVQTQVSGIKHQTQAMHSTHVMATAMAKTTGIMATQNKQMRVEYVQKTMMEFEKQNMYMDMKEDVMNETLDAVLGDEQDEEEGDMIMNQILDEIGIEISTKSARVPQGMPQGSMAAASSSTKTGAVKKMAE